MTDMNPALVGQQQPPTNLEWPATNAHNRADRLSPSAEKTPNWGVLPSKSGQVGKGLKVNSKEETKHDIDYSGREIGNPSHPGHLRPQNHHDNGIVEPSERPKSRQANHQDYAVPLDDANPRIGQPPVSPIVAPPQMGSPMPPLQMSPAQQDKLPSLSGSPSKSPMKASGQSGSSSKVGTSDTEPSSKLSANAPVFQPSQKKDGALWEYHPSKSSRGGRSGSMDGTDGFSARGGTTGGGGGGHGGGATGSSSRVGKPGSSAGVMSTQEDRTLQKLNLVYPNGPTPETHSFLASRGPKAPRYEYLSSATTWLPGQNHTFDWNGFVYTLAQPIHMGMNGHIHHCSRQQRTTSGEVAARKKNVAAKVVPNTLAFEREIIILRALQQDCNNIIKLRDVIELPTCLISIMELAQTDVHQFFAGRSAKQHGWRLDKTATREYFARMVVNDVVHGLKQMHERRYLHCDLKAQNILMFIWRSSRKGGSYVQAKLTDFGHSWKGQVRMAERLFPNGMARVGTAGHVAPELFVEGSACGPKIDIWSLGVVMFSMLVPGHLPFGEYSNLATLRKAHDIINNPEIPFNDNSSWSVLFNSCSPEARDLILWMTRLDPNERPDEEAILNHPWFHIARGIKDTSGYRSKLQFWGGMSHFSRAFE